MERLDGALFELDGLIDYSARIDGRVLKISAVGTANVQKMAERAGKFAQEVEVSQSAPTAAHRGCYMAKRHLLV